MSIALKFAIILPAIMVLFYSLLSIPGGFMNLGMLACSERYLM